MMRKLHYFIISLSCLAMACNDNSSSEDKKDANLYIKCSVNQPCPDPYVCSATGECFLPMNTPECSPIKPCTGVNQICSAQGKCIQNPAGQNPAEPECSQIKPCNGPKQICSPEGKCIPVIAAEPECSSSKPCVGANQTCTTDGRCVSSVSDPSETEEACSNSNPCKGLNQVCTNGVCLNTSTQSCYGKTDCPDGFVCDNLKCVDERSCSMTRTCKGDLICQDGLCVPKPAVECDSKMPCQDSGKTCVAGHCVVCSCQPNEVCLADGSCVPKGVSTTKGIKDGDPCTWNPDFAFCENNQMFNCVSSNNNPHVVTSNSCGAKICTQTSEEGIGCHEPCVAEGAYYGECVDLYSADNTLIAFTHICEKTPAGLVWTFTAGYEECEVGCVDGRCVFVPSEFGEPCTANTYPDACQGDWMTYCYSQGSTLTSIKSGTYCPGLSKDHFCSLPSESALALDRTILGYCNLPCQENGKRHFECASDGENNQYSLEFLCALDTNGKLSDFQLSKSFCMSGCNLSTGECK